ncbi:glyceraldehyde 3-phosphate dehydrogenase NAD-binding domain-containing protein, partial [Hydrotalea sp.]|uniref:glyceraldehyde 3-phosphate dehydrogenase NAD-binding domain-containing protein n=1 Tax=Hydrotalea sp. TaxID=2881279 RepID=UPI0026082370
EGGITVDGKKIPATMIPDISAIPWENYGVDVVIDATGAFTKKVNVKLAGVNEPIVLTIEGIVEDSSHSK